MNSTTVPAPAPASIETPAGDDVCLYLLVALGGIAELAPQTLPKFEKE